MSVLDRGRTDHREPMGRDRRNSEFVDEEALRAEWQRIARTGTASRLPSNCS